MNWIARIIMGLLGLGFLAALLLGLLCYIVFATVRWLLTGRKPQVVMVWQQFSHLRKAAHWRSGPRQAHATDQSPSEDVIDVDVKEVPEYTPLLPRDRVN